MSKDIMQGTPQPEITVGFDIGDRFSQLCLLDSAGEVIEESRLATTLSALTRKFAHAPRARIVLESTTHSPWIARTLTALGDAESPGDLLLAADLSIAHVLVDEFQDTSWTHLELIARLTSGWSPGDGRTLSGVGAPMRPN